jgi:topoisomerase-4 subunit A
MSIHTPPPEGGRIVDEPMSEALSKRYLAYALSTITNRALPDVRDGFKPVHRRIMYAMHQMRLNPQAAARKCAKVVGEVMGTYHPHGDASIYDAPGAPGPGLRPALSAGRRTGQFRQHRRR